MVAVAPAVLRLAKDFVSTLVAKPMALGACTGSASCGADCGARWRASFFTMRRCVTSGSAGASMTAADGFALGFVEVVVDGAEACVFADADPGPMSSGCSEGLAARVAVPSDVGTLAAGAGVLAPAAADADDFALPVFFQVRYPAEQASSTTAATITRAFVLPPPSLSSSES